MNRLTLMRLTDTEPTAITSGYYQHLCASVSTLPQGRTGGRGGGSGPCPMPLTILSTPVQKLHMNQLTVMGLTGTGKLKDMKVLNQIYLTRVARDN